MQSVSVKKIMSKAQPWVFQTMIPIMQIQAMLLDWFRDTVGIISVNML